MMTELLLVARRVQLSYLERERETKMKRILDITVDLSPTRLPTTIAAAVIKKRAFESGGQCAVSFHLGSMRSRNPIPIFFLTSFDSKGQERSSENEFSSSGAPNGACAQQVPQVSFSSVASDEWAHTRHTVRARARVRPVDTAIFVDDRKWTRKNYRHNRSIDKLKHFRDSSRARPLKNTRIDNNSAEQERKRILSHIYMHWKKSRRWRVI